MKARNTILTSLFCLLLLTPCALWAAQEGLRLPLPDWLTAESATYLSGGISESHLEKHLSLKGFETEELQEALTTEIENHIPFKATVLLANASLQRNAIAASNLVANFEAYPTFFGSKTVYIPQHDALADYPSTKQWTLKRTKKTAEGIAKIASQVPDKNFYLVVADMSYTSASNPAHQLVANALSTNDYLEVLNEGTEETPNVHVVSLTYDDDAEYYRNYYRTDHHWNGYGTLALYRTLQATAKLPYTVEEPRPTLSFPGLATNGSYARDGLMLLNEAVEEPAFDLTGLEVQNTELPPIAQADSVEALLAMGPIAEYSFYTQWYGSSLLTAQSPLVNQASPSDKRALVIMDSYADSLHWLLARNYTYLQCYRDIRDGEEGDFTLIDRINETDADDIYFVGSTSAYTRPPQYLPHYFDLPGDTTSSKN
ncbi:hypothetical protein PZH32_07455 [Adlercreutzia equolifaciens]|uniref:hypothetical protein n=1 Tax=Adlercreutzia equolifaciens TaxID=446660 RepID=UPI0023AE8C7A|nr:hypothetical protein [Adlercreutzia equolifaciens]MDE8702800.1 hypothetical protein [Adlercreutzia equolifaciens]